MEGLPPQLCQDRQVTHRTTYEDTLVMIRIALFNFSAIILPSSFMLHTICCQWDVLHVAWLSASFVCVCSFNIVLWLSFEHLKSIQ